MAGPIGAAPVDIRLEPLNARFEQPVHITYAPGDPNHLWIVEQPGTVRVYDLESDLLLPTPFLSIPEQLAAGGERGLLSLAFHPDFQDNGRFFVNYTDRAGNTQVVEYRVGSDPLVADPATARRLLTIEQPAPNHNGGMMAFGPDGYLYIGTGDGGRAGDPWNNAQNLGTLLGKLLRIDVDRGVPYGIPPDNPFAGRPGARGEIWAYGLRNPWKFSFDRATGDLYIADVGQNLWEEINFEPAAHSGGRNYGWNRMEGAHCYPGGSRCDTRGLVMPVAEYRHRPDMGCSITGGYVYRGRAIPKLYGYYVFSDYCSGRIWAMSTAPAAAYGQGGAPGGMWPYEDLARTSFRITAFGEDLAGELYVADHSGRVFRLLPTAQR
ncbi:MAG: PQQ-dependent sugar dehydrogenase [Firmicutes bacterium]|nr:PQQ-dependent sugar dehydrogenase [Bacillota bacterium]